MSESNKTNKGKKGNRRYRPQRKKDSENDITNQTVLNGKTIKSKCQGQKNESLQDNNNNKGKRKDAYKSKKQNKDKPILNEFTFKNISDVKSKYINSGIQTLSPIKLCIDEIFNNGFNKPYVSDSNNNNSKLQEWNISSFGSRGDSIDENISFNDDDGRKWSNASTIIGSGNSEIDNNIYRSRRSSSLTSNVTIVGNGKITKDPTLIRFEDPFLLKEPLTIEDLNSNDSLKLDRDMIRLKNAINEIEEERNDDLQIPSDIIKDMWLDYPTCCYNALLQD